MFTSYLKQAVLQLKFKHSCLFSVQCSLQNLIPQGHALPRLQQLNAAQKDFWTEYRQATWLIYKTKKPIILGPYWLDAGGLYNFSFFSGYNFSAANIGKSLPKQIYPLIYKTTLYIKNILFC